MISLHDIAVRIADSSKSPSEREEQDVHEHMTGNRDRPHSRDNAGKGPPAIWNRRKRVKQDDPDVDSADPDMSLNYKSAASPKSKGEGKSKKPPSDFGSPQKKIEKRLRDASPKLVDRFRRDLKQMESSNVSKTTVIQDRLAKIDEAASSTFDKLKSSDDVSKAISAAWNSSKNQYDKAGIIEAVKKLALRFKVPGPVKNLVLKPREEALDEDVVGLMDVSEKSFDVSKYDIDEFVSLVTAYRVLYECPKTVSSSDIENEDLSERIHEQVSSAAGLSKIMSTWTGMLKKFTPGEDEQVDVSDGDWSQVLGRIHNFLTKSKNPIVDPGKCVHVMLEDMRDKLGEIPKSVEDEAKKYGEKTEDGDEKNVEDEIVKEVLGELKEKYEKRRNLATSYETFSHKMPKTATFHGIIQQGHPTDDVGDSATSYDKRYFGKKHFDSIVNAAKEFLSQDWLKYGWGECPGDVPTRAALDLAISTADGGLYQSKIDANTYNMLLNQLAGWDYDVFCDTVFVPSKSRKASVMTNPVHEILKVADEMRSTHPRLAMQIIKNVHAIMRSAAGPDAENKPDHEDPSLVRDREERQLAEKLVLQSFEEKGAERPSSSKLKEIVDEILKGLDELEDEAHASGIKVSSLSNPQVLSIIIRMAHEMPAYRKHLPVIAAAVKKVKKPSKKQEKEDKKDEKKTSKKQETKKPAKKDEKKKDEKKPSGNKRKASFSLTSDDATW